MKPGEFSHRLGIPASTVRYYDRQGITKSGRDSGNNYREFDALDALDIYNALMLRSFDMSLRNISRAEYDLEEIDTFMSRHIPDLESQIRLEEMRLERLREMKRFIEAMETGVGKALCFDVQKSYAIWTLNDDHALSSRETEAIRRLAESFPYTYVALAIEDTQLEHQTEYTVKAGLGIMERNARKCGIVECPELKTIDGQKTYGVFLESEDPLHLTRTDLEPIFTRAAEDGARLQSNAYGRIYLRYKKNGRAVYGCSIGILSDPVE